MDLNNNRKKYVKINQNTGHENFFALLDGMQSDLEDDIDKLMNNLNRVCICKGGF